MLKQLYSVSLLVVMLIACSLGAAAQRQRNYIYVFDCTQSMQHHGIWDPAKNALYHTMENRGKAQPESNNVVIPFQGTAYEPIIFSGRDFAKQRGNIDKTFDGYIKNVTNTNILAAMQSAMKNVDSHMDNRIYIITDGAHNAKGGKPIDVARAISRWCDSHPANVKLFYVTLTKEAADQCILQAIEACSDAYAVDVENGVIPSICDVGNVVYANTLELPRAYELLFSEPGDYPLTCICNDPYFDVAVKDGKVKDCRFAIVIKPKMPMDGLGAALQQQVDAEGNYVFHVSLNSATRGLEIVNPEITVVMNNREQRELTILGGSNEELRPEKVSSYPKFLFCDEKKAEPITIDLAPIFNNASEQATMAQLAIVPDDGKPCDYQLMVNGEPVDSTFIVGKGDSAVLTLNFLPESESGKRYFTIKCTGARELEKINGVPLDKAEPIQVCTKYSRDMNPLLVALLWLLAILLAALLIWFLVLRKMIYPTFAVSTVTFSSNDYFRQVRIKGCRRMVLTSATSKQHQGLLSRIFTGKIVYVKDQHWTSDCEAVPASGKKIRFVGCGNWLVSPGFTLARFTEAEMENVADHSKTSITVN